MTDPTRTGLDLPDVLIALGLQPPIGLPATQTFGAMPSAPIGALFGSSPAEGLGSLTGPLGRSQGNANNMFGGTGFDPGSAGALWANYGSLLQNPTVGGQPMPPRRAEVGMGMSTDSLYGTLMANPYAYPIPITALQAFGYPVRPGGLGLISW